MRQTKVECYYSFSDGVVVPKFYGSQRLVPDLVRTKGSNRQIQEQRIPGSANDSARSRRTRTFIHPADPTLARRRRSITQV